jgi:hypothetical protein
MLRYVFSGWHRLVLGVTELVLVFEAVGTCLWVELPGAPIAILRALRSFFRLLESLDVIVASTPVSRSRFAVLSSFLLCEIVFLDHWIPALYMRRL